jgi:hypothetical protein
MPISARKRVRKRHALPAPKPARAHILVIECDSRRLASQGLHLGTVFGGAAQVFLQNKRIAVVQTSTEDQLRTDLAEVSEKFGRFPAVMIVGHSDASSLNLTSNDRYPWAVVGKWLRIFQPEILFLVACEAGQSAAPRALFGSIESLREVYASPVTLWKEHAASLIVLALMLLLKGKISSGLSSALRMAQYVQSGGQVYRWRRNEVGPGAEVSAAFLDWLSQKLAGRWDLFGGTAPGNPAQRRAQQ